MSKNDRLFKGKFNWYGQIFKLYTHSSSKEKSFQNFLRQLSKKLDIGYWTVWQRFNGDIDNYSIQEIKK